MTACNHSSTTTTVTAPTAPTSRARAPAPPRAASTAGTRATSACTSLPRGTRASGTSDKSYVHERRHVGLPRIGLHGTQEIKLCQNTHDRVNDTVCDCCDGSDESPQRRCPNTCTEIVRARTTRTLVSCTLLCFAQSKYPSLHNKPNPFRNPPLLYTRPRPPAARGRSRSPCSKPAGPSGRST